MSSEWTKTQIGSLGRIVTGKTPATERSEYFDGHIPFLTPTDMADGHKMVKPIRSLTEAGLATVRNCLVHRGVAVSCIGWQMGKSVLVLEPTVTNQQIHSIVVDESRYDLAFIYYLLTSMRSRIFELGATATRTPIVNKTTFSEVSVLVPDLDTQKGIASFFSVLDDRIALLRETNSTLEAIAQALFKSWFIDFDPVRAKMEGRAPEGMDEATAALFPDSFEESELGVVPRGWPIGRLDDFLVLQRGFDLPAQDRTPGTYPIIAASGPSGTHREAMVKGPGVVTGRSGVLGRVFLEFGDYWPLNTTLWVKEFRAATPCFAYELLRLLDFKSFNAGSAVPTLNRNHIHGLSYVIPGRGCVDAFEAIGRPLHERVKGNEARIQTLSAVRDTLLPRLISGQLRLPESAGASTLA